MENKTNPSNPASAQNTSYNQDSTASSTAASSGNQPQSASSTSNQDSQGGIMGTITDTIGKVQIPDAVKNVQLPQAVKDFCATCSRSFSGLTTTQKVVGGAALALGATYLAATSNGWMGMGKSNKSEKYGKSGKAGKTGKYGQYSGNQHS